MAPGAKDCQVRALALRCCSRQQEQKGTGRRKRAIVVRPDTGRGLRAQAALKAGSLTLAVPYSPLPGSFQSAMTGSLCSSSKEAMQLGLGYREGYRSPGSHHVAPAKAHVSLSHHMCVGGVIQAREDPSSIDPQRQGPNFPSPPGYLPARDTRQAPSFPGEGLPEREPLDAGDRCHLSDTHTRLLPCAAPWKEDSQLLAGKGAA